jgi:hypothetical protein
MKTIKTEWQGKIINDPGRYGAVKLDGLPNYILEDLYLTHKFIFNEPEQRNTANSREDSREAVGKPTPSTAKRHTAASSEPIGDAPQNSTKGGKDVAVTH